MNLQAISLAFGGGVVIGSAATFFLLLNGRMAGISSILGGLWSHRIPDLSWRMCFLLGLVLGGTILQSLHPKSFGAGPQASLAVLTVSGLLVGLGSRLANGCTSGHGVCGLSRKSLRSLVATITFMSTAMLTVFVSRHLLSIDAQP
jgi:uncharacterized membrane protein YedE/YeeE